MRYAMSQLFDQGGKDDLFVNYIRDQSNVFPCEMNSAESGREKHTGQQRQTVMEEK